MIVIMAAAGRLSALSKRGENQAGSSISGLWRLWKAGSGPIPYSRDPSAARGVSTRLTSQSRVTGTTFSGRSISMAVRWISCYGPIAESQRRKRSLERPLHHTVLIRR